MKTKKPRLKHNPIEYHLFVALQYDERQDEQMLQVELHTIKEFTSFQYELVVKETLELPVLTLNIIGLKAPKTNVPTTGVARYRKLFAQPAAIKKIVIQKMDKKENSFPIRITEQRITIKGKPESPFVEIVTNNDPR